MWLTFEKSGNDAVDVELTRASKHFGRIHRIFVLNTLKSQHWTNVCSSRKIVTLPTNPAFLGTKDESLCCPCLLLSGGSGLCPQDGRDCHGFVVGHCSLGGEVFVFQRLLFFDCCCQRPRCRGPSLEKTVQLSSRHPTLPFFPLPSGRTNRRCRCSTKVQSCTLKNNKLRDRFLNKLGQNG